MNWKLTESESADLKIMKRRLEEIEFQMSALAVVRECKEASRASAHCASASALIDNLIGKHS